LHNTEFRITNISIGSFLTYIIGVIVFFIGVTLTKRFKTLQGYNIPEPVIGGLLAALKLALICQHVIAYRCIFTVIGFSTGKDKKQP
jgi:sodium--glutamate symport carrier gltS